MLLQATPLIIIGAGLTVAFRANIWNIGAEGQFYAGGVAGAVAGIYLGDLPAAISRAPGILASALLAVPFGACWPAGSRFALAPVKS